MATQKLKKQKKVKTKRPPSKMRAHQHTHAFILEPDGRVTCECDPLMTFAHTAKEAKKISDWFAKVSDFLRSKSP